MTEPNPKPALMETLALLLEEWAEALQLHGHRASLRIHIISAMLEIARAMRPGEQDATENKPEETPQKETAQSAN